MRERDFEDFVLGPTCKPLFNALTKHELDVLTLSNAIAGEAGELANLVKKAVRPTYYPGARVESPEFLGKAAYELGDLLHYMVRLMSVLGYTMEEVMALNKLKLEMRDREAQEVVRANPSAQP